MLSFIFSLTLIIAVVIALILAVISFFKEGKIIDLVLDQLYFV